MKKEKTVARKLKIMALGMSLIALSLLILALPVSLAGEPVSIYATTTMSPGPPPTPAPPIHPTIGEYKEPTGSISVTSEPSEADVYLDEMYVGRTPVTLVDVLIGPHGIKLTKDGYRSNSINLYVEPDIIRSLEIVLSPILIGNISAISEPSEADVYLDAGEYVGTTPVVFNASAGLHDILFVKEGYESYSTDTSVKHGETVVVKGVLSSILLGNIYATSDPDGADVYFDGEYVGKTPVEVNASAGPYDIRFAKEGYERDDVFIFVGPGETVEVMGILTWYGVKVISSVIFILSLLAIIILLLYFLFPIVKKKKEYRLEQEKK